MISNLRYRTAATATIAKARAEYLTRDQAGRTDDREVDEQQSERVVDYLDRHRKNGGFFDADRDRVSRQEVATDLARGERIYALVLNPLEGDHPRFNPHRFTRDTMAAVERDLNFKPGQLRWFAVVHKANRFDRNNVRHVHVVWASQRIDDPRFQMRISRSYVTKGFQLRASQAMEAQLGPMRPHEMDRLRASLAANADRARMMLELDKRGAPIGVIRQAGREWISGALAREPMSPEQREHKAELRRLRHQQSEARTIARELRAMGRGLDEQAATRVRIDDLAQAVERAGQGAQFADVRRGLDAAKRWEWKPQEQARIRDADELAGIRREMVQLANRLSTHFDQLHELKLREGELRDAIAQRQNVVARWLHGRASAKLERVKTAMNQNRAERQKAHAEAPSKGRTRKLDRLDREAATLRRGYARAMTKIRSRMTLGERQVADSIKDLRQRTHAAITRDKAEHARLKAVLKERSRAPSISTPFARERERSAPAWERGR